jgi:outer membrane protein OmpA-like peptidoglycan-associated protein
MKSNVGTLRALMASLFLLSFLVGCANVGLEYAPKGPYLYYHKELVAAERAVEVTRRAGKDKECPEEFNSVERMKVAAYETYWACRTADAIAMANQVVTRAQGLCPPKKVVLPPPAPTASLSANPDSIQSGQCSTLTWSSGNATSATIDQGVGKVNLSGSWPVCPRTTTQYTLAVVGEGGTRQATATVGVTAPPAPTVSLSANPASIQTGQCATLVWTSANATSATIDQGIGSVDLAGLRQVCPTSTTQYTLAVVGEGGTRQATATVGVTAPPAPTVSLSANPASIQTGQCATLVWTSANATSATIDQGVGAVDLSGLRQVCPTATTQYTITTVGRGGSRAASTTVGVTAPPAPTVSLSANPASIQTGQCATLVWTSANATSATIDQGIGSVDLAGLRQVCPTSTTQYTLAVVGEGGTRQASTTVGVTAPPAPKVIDRLAIHVNFDFDKSVIRSSDIAELQKAVDFVKKYEGYKISIEGHTDSIGTEQYNQRLSERRAAAVRDYLLKQGVADGARIKSAGYGKSKPIADNETEEGRFQNRRVEILILSE